MLKNESTQQVIVAATEVRWNWVRVGMSRLLRETTERHRPKNFLIIPPCLRALRGFLFSRSILVAALLLQEIGVER